MIKAIMSRTLMLFNPFFVVSVTVLISSLLGLKYALVLCLLKNKAIALIVSNAFY